MSFNSGEPNQRQGVCRAYANGNCTYGARCKYAHVAGANQRQGVCRAYASGSCSYGARCKYAHVDQLSRPAHGQVPPSATQGDGSEKPYHYVPEPDLYPGKLGLCDNYDYPRPCKYGHKCLYAHEMTELLTVRYKTADGSEYGVCPDPSAFDRTGGLLAACRNPQSIIRICKTFNGVACPDGKYCRDLHVSDGSKLQPQSKRSV